MTAEPVARLIEEFDKLPGIGPKSAQRLTFYLLRMSAKQARGLAEAIVEVKERIGFCTTCFNITESDPCRVCRGTRDKATICVVEEPLDVSRSSGPAITRGSTTSCTARSRRWKGSGRTSCASGSWSGGWVRRGDPGGYPGDQPEPRGRGDRDLPDHAPDADRAG